MDGFLRQSTAITVKIGPFKDSGDGDADETALTLSQADIRLSKNGGNYAQKNESSSCTHDELGEYNCSLDTTDTNTLGILRLAVHESGALSVWHTWQVVTANFYDTMCSTDQFDVNVTNIEGSDATDQIRDAVVDDATRIDASQLNTHSAITAAGIVNEWETQSQADPTGFHVNVLEVNGTAQTANDNGADINAILVDTAEIGAAGAGLTAIPWNAAWDAEVQSEVNDALIANNLDHLCLTATASADMTTEVADNTIISRILAAGDTSAFVPSTDSLQNIRDELAVVDGNVDSVLTDTADMQPRVVAIEADTNELQGDWANGGRLDLIIDELTTQGDTNEGKIDTIDTNVDSILADTGTDGVVVAAASKTGYTLSNAGIDALFDRNSSLSISYEALIERTYEMVNNKMTVNETTGAVALRNIGDSADIATGNVASSSGTTTRAELSWP